MAPLLIKLLTILPSLVNAKDALKKDNLKAPSTSGALVPVVAAIMGPDAIGMAPDSLEAVLTQVALAVVALVMFFAKSKKSK
jgi:hypothetical protein